MKDASTYWALQIERIRLNDSWHIYAKPSFFFFSSFPLSFFLSFSCACSLCSPSHLEPIVHFSFLCWPVNSPFLFLGLLPFWPSQKSTYYKYVSCTFFGFFVLSCHELENGVKLRFCEYYYILSMIFIMQPPFWRSLLSYM